MTDEQNSEESGPEAAPPNTASSGGYFMAFPILAPADATLTALQIAMTPWKSPAYFAAQGVRQDTGEDGAFVVIDWPWNYFQVEGDVEKHALERLHLDQFCTDYLLATGTLPYRDIAANASDPPDFHVEAADRRIGLECTQLALEERRVAHGLFDALRRAVLAEPRERFIDLRGQILNLWFIDEEKQVALPHRRHDDSAIAAIIERLAAYAPDPERLHLTTPGLPEQAPPLELEHTGMGCAFYASPMLNGAAPASRFFAATGFELALAYQSFFSRASILAQLAASIQRKDDLGVDADLLITVGGPNQRGLVFPAEPALLSLGLANDPLDLAPPTHLRRVHLHCWGVGVILELFPDRRLISPGIYTGAAPAHFGGIEFGQPAPFAPPSDE